MRDYGKEAHAAFEKRLLKGTKLPMDLQHHEPKLAALAAAPGEGVEEQKLALNKNYQPTGFFDDDVWVRAVIDYCKMHKNHGVIIDHKFGRPSDNFDQLDLMVAVLSVFQPQIDFFTGAFYWAKQKRFATKKYTRGDVPDIWASFMPRVTRMEHARKNDEYPARANFLCKRHCKVRTCPYHGV